MTDYFGGRIFIQQTPAVIASSGTTSGNLATNGGGLVGLIMPAAFTGTTMTFNGSDDGANFYALYNTSGTQLSITVAVNRMILFTPGDLVGPQFIQLVSGSTEGSSRTIQCIVRSFV